ncbi:CHAD domain-containing protein [Mycoplana dimorpha]|uniref:CHAD domain-containing protein n=1 Tax=Mycoplana dimorpha TaxID=28320 RepID=A0A2T5B5N4_MYCDI|nr:CHAD domain-containing protein [Mycoplana dimorpha]PTM94270.1 CHAD domain-containing protein [Mycoplana dimorpha]
MSRTIKPDEPLDSEVRRIASHYLGRARSQLEDQPEGPHEAIHTARKQFKRIRSLYRLVAAADKAFQKAENERIGAMGRSLSASRDATSLVETARRLAGAAATAQQHMALERVHQRLVERRDALAATAAIDDLIRQAITTCDEAEQALDRFRFGDGHKRAAEILGRGWYKTGKRAALALRLARESGAAQRFHDLRKRTQDRWVHCRFLAEAWPVALLGTRTQAGRLVKLLGENQDIALLSNFTATDPDGIGPKDLAHLVAVMSTEQTRLREEALPLAATLFPDDARQDAERIALLWRHAG